MGQFRLVEAVPGPVRLVRQSQQAISRRGRQDRVAGLGRVVLQCLRAQTHGTKRGALVFKLVFIPTTNGVL